MDKKNKLMAALAIGAVVLLVGSSITRCAITQAVDEAKPEEPVQTIEQAQEEPTENAIALLGGTEDLYETFGKSRDDFEKVLDAYVEEKSIPVTNAIWDCQIWIDFAEGSYLTNFTLNDDMATIVTVQLDANGKLKTL